MKNAVTIKSFPNGITVYLHPELPFEELLKEVAFKFREADSFFQDAKTALALEGRDLTEEQQRQVLEVIGENSRLQILCLVGKETDTDQLFVKAVEQLQKEEQEEKGRFYRGNLHYGQTLEVEGSIIMIGDVERGAHLVAGRDIIILGGLYGMAQAGAGGRPRSFIAALEMAPEKLKIGDFKYKSKEKSKWSLKTPKIQPKIAYVDVSAGQIAIEPLTRDLMDGLPL